MELGVINGVSSEQYEKARAMMVEAYKRTVNRLGFYFGVEEIPHVRIELAPLLSSGGIIRDDQGRVTMIINANDFEIGEKRTSQNYENWLAESKYSTYHETGHILHCAVNPAAWSIPRDDSPRARRLNGLGETIAETFAVLSADLSGFFCSEERMKFPFDWAIDLYKNIGEGCGTAVGIFVGSIANTPLDYAIKNIPEIKPILDSYM